MKVPSRPAASIAPPFEHPYRSLALEEPPQLTEAYVPRAAMSLRHDLGFSAASQHLAWRRSAAIAEEDNRSEAMQPNFSHRRPPSHPMAGCLPEGQSKGWPQYPRQIDRYRILAEADWERSQLTSQDQFEPHDLDQLLLGSLCQQLRRYPIARAELVKKTLRFFPEQPLYVMLICPAASCAEQPLSSLSSTLGTQIAQELCFSRELLVCLTQDTEPQLVERIRAKCPGQLLNAMD